MSYFHDNNRNTFLNILSYRSISRKISAQYGMNDEIDFNDLNLDDDVGDCVAKETSDNDLGRSQGRSSFTNALPTRRESRGISQVSRL